MSQTYTEPPVPFGYTKIPFALNYAVKPTGEIIHLPSGKAPAIWFSKKNEKQMVSIGIGGTKRTQSVAFILASTFIPVPLELIDANLRVFHKNRNKSDYSLDNLEWKDRSYEISLVFMEKVAANKLKYDVPLFDGIDTGYYPSPVECKLAPGYYYLPGSDHPLVLNKAGEVLNLDSEMAIAPHLNGPYVVQILRVGGKYQTFYLHRLLAMLFIEIPSRHKGKPFDELEVNHMDGNKKNNALDNLEWVTPVENSRHAIDNGLCNFEAVLVKDINTGEIVRCPSCWEAAREFDVDKKRLMRHLNGKSTGKITRNWKVFKYDDDSLWPTLTEKDREENKWDNTFGIWIATNGTNRVLGNTLEKLAETLSIPYVELQVHVGSPKREKACRGWLLTYDDSPSAQDVASLPPRYKPVWQESKKLVSTHLTTGGVIEHASYKQAGRDLGISPSRIRYAIENYRGKADGYLFKYV